MIPSVTGFLEQDFEIESVCIKCHGWALPEPFAMVILAFPALAE